MKLNSNDFFANSVADAERSGWGGLADVKEESPTTKTNVFTVGRFQTTGE